MNRSGGGGRMGFIVISPLLIFLWGWISINSITSIISDDLFALPLPSLLFANKFDPVNTADGRRRVLGGWLMAAMAA